MTPANARDCAFNLATAVRQLRKYADLMDHGIECPVELEMAMNNIRSGLNDLGAYVTAQHSPDQLHARMKTGRDAEAALFDGVATCRAGLSMGR